MQLSSTEPQGMGQKEARTHGMPPAPRRQQWGRAQGGGAGSAPKPLAAELGVSTGLSPPPLRSYPVSLPADVGRGGDRAAGGQIWSWCELAPGHQQQPRSQGPAAEHRPHPTPATTGAGWGLSPREGSGLCYKQSSAGTFLSPACDDCQLPPALSLPRGFRRPPRCAGSLRCKCGARYNPGEGTARHEAPRGGTASLPGYRGGGHQA